MKLVTYLDQGKEKVGVLSLDEQAVRPLPYDSMLSAIEAGLDAVKKAEQGRETALSSVKLYSPIPFPRQDVICLGMNYVDHAKESAKFNGEAFVEEKSPAVYFSKRVSQAVPPNGYIDSHSGLVEQLDYEAELAVIIGPTASKVTPEKAGEYIFGYTIINDVSARVLQTLHKQWYYGKGLDGFAPMGPCIVTADEIAFPPALAITSRVNGEARQSARTDQLITSIAQVISELTAGMTLLPGTIIATGTPAGAGMGYTPPKFLKPGDVVECEIEKIGVLKNTVQ